MKLTQPIHFKQNYNAYLEGNDYYNWLSKTRVRPDGASLSIKQKNLTFSLLLYPKFETILFKLPRYVSLLKHKETVPNLSININEVYN